MEKIYNIKFDNPPIKYLSKIKDEWIIEVFENRSQSEWIDLGNKYNISGIIVPSNWKIDVINQISSDKYTLYKLK